MARRASYLALDGAGHGLGAEQLARPPDRWRTVLICAALLTTLTGAVRWAEVAAPSAICRRPAGAVGNGRRPASRVRALAIPPRAHRERRLPALPATGLFGRQPTRAICTSATLLGTISRLFIKLQGLAPSIYARDRLPMPSLKPPIYPELSPLKQTCHINTRSDCGPP